MIKLEQWLVWFLQAVQYLFHLASNALAKIAKVKTPQWARHPQTRYETREHAVSSASVPLHHGAHKACPFWKLFSWCVAVPLIDYIHLANLCSSLCCLQQLPKYESFSLRNPNSFFLHTIPKATWQGSHGLLTDAAPLFVKAATTKVNRHTIQ